MSFQSLFQRVLPRLSDRRNISALSFDGKTLASVGHGGGVMLVDTQFGNTIGFLNFAHYPPVSFMNWINETQLLVGNTRGGISQATLTPAAEIPNNSNPLASVVTIIPQSEFKATSMCYNPIHNLFAIGFSGEIQIWCLRLTPQRQRRWVLFDSIECEDEEGTKDSATTMIFFGANAQSLCAFTFNKFVIWDYSDKSLRWHAHDWGTFFRCCAVSPDGKSMAVSTTDLSVLIWPLHGGGPCIHDQQVFEIPSGRNWIEYAETTPVTYFDAETILTTDPVGNIYIVSLDGRKKEVFPVGENYFVRAILIHESMINLVTMGPACTTMLIGLTNNARVHRRVAKEFKAQAPLMTDHCVIQQRVATVDSLARATAADSFVAKVSLQLRRFGLYALSRHFFSTLVSYVRWRHLVASILVLIYNDLLALDLLTVFNVPALTVQFTLAEFVMRVIFYLAIRMLRLFCYGFFVVTRACIVYFCTLILRYFSD
ncbi:hypothetical protein FRC12_023933 [Ceratobasidium sp. 428]|nr:hypothetical protein FRC12_023933 [Ceratobasidium sp. 428]